MLSRVMVLEEFNKPLVEKEVEIPQLSSGEVLVKISASGVCGSDVHMWKGEDPRTPLPIVLGHEGVGEIVEINGSKKTVDGIELKTGDTILWNRGITCGKCFYCKVARQPFLCEDRKVYGINISFNEHPHLNGCYSEYIVLRHNTDVFKIPKDIDPAIIVNASCSGATAAHGFDIIKPGNGDVVVIQGPGPVGIFSVAFAKACGVKEIVVIGGTQKRLDLCREFGATRILNRHETTREDRKQAIFELTRGRGADYVIEAAGYPQALREGLGLVRPGGTYLSMGFAQPMGSIEFDGYSDLVRKNIRIMGVWVSDTRHTFQAMNLVLSNPEAFEKMISHRYPLLKANEALRAMDNKEALKAVLIP
ncbi:MAG: hypothetical protein PWQ82_708 [Thermosediminibacterales bacterium]|nr:hypothetical protein [Thermosediminibacterales bacterium]MDK2836638.1 hypothetical protein [Thermosediminibacterales bacterium]